MKAEPREGQGEYGWFRLAPDKTEPMFGYVDKTILATQGVLAHTAEFYPPNERQQPNDGTQRPGSPDVSLATETRKPGSLK